MARYTIYRHPLTGEYQSVKKGFAFWAMLLNVAGVGFIWAFVKKTGGFAWRLLAISLIAWALLLVTGPFAWMVSLLWIAFSGTIGNIANRELGRSLKRRGFNVVADDVQSSGPDAAIERALSAGLTLGA